MSSSNTAFIRALENEGVQCQVVDIDYQRSFSAFGAVDTHYIIQVRATQECDSRCRFKTFNIEKSFHNFRNLVNAFKKASRDATIKMKKTGGWTGVPESTQNIIAFSEAFSHVIESEPVSHFVGKMTFSSVQELAGDRRKTLDKALRVLTENYPSSRLGECAAMQEFKQIVNDFFLTDHVYEEEEQAHQRIAADASVSSIETKTIPPVKPASNASKVVNGPDSSTEDPSSPLNVIQSQEKEKGLNKAFASATRTENTTPQVQPKSMKKRAPVTSRNNMKTELMKSKSLRFHDENSSVKQEENKWDSPFAVFGIFFGLAMFLLWLPNISVTVQLDVAAVVAFTCVIVGINIAPRPTENTYETSGRDTFQNRQRVDSETLLRTSMGVIKPSERSNLRTTFRSQSIFSSVVSSATENFEASKGKSPLQKFPDDAEIGSIFNCWSEPVASEFNVRGANYLRDKIKVASGPFLFPARGVDIFLSDCCPDHIARYKAIMGSRLREKPTILINYRLPWGNCVTYSEIPSRFLPFLNYCYDKSLPLPSMDGMSKAEVCACRYLMADNKGKDEILKIVPKVVKGPWIVKKACDGKPAIVCNKMPTQYFYEAASEGKAEYLEIDLDIVASSAARAILAVAQRYTKTLTLDLGFVLQGNSEDELPEQMTFGARLHGLDPVNASMLPQSIDGSL